MTKKTETSGEVIKCEGRNCICPPNERGQDETLKLVKRWVELQMMAHARKYFNCHGTALTAQCVFSLLDSLQSSAPQATLPEVFDTKAAYEGAKSHQGIHGDPQFVKGARWMFERLKKGAK